MKGISFAKESILISFKEAIEVGSINDEVVRQAREFIVFLAKNILEIKNILKLKIGLTKPFHV